MDILKDYEEAKAALELHEAAANPSNPSYGDWTDEEWGDYWDYLIGLIYAIEQSMYYG